MDDDFYDAWQYFPDSRDTTRHGLGLRVEVRGFQWANPQAGNVIFWHYDITNEGTTDYDNIVFGLYMDSGVGGSALSCDGIFESDDDNAFFDKSSRPEPGLHLGPLRHGRDLERQLQPHRLPRLRATSRRPATRSTASTTTTMASPTSGATAARARRSSGQDGDPRLRRRALRHWPSSRRALRPAREPRRPYRVGQLVDRRRGHGLARRVQRRRRRRRARTRTTPARATASRPQGEPNFDRDRSQRVGPDRAHRLQDEPHQGRRQAIRIPTTDGILFYTDASNWPRAALQQVHRSLLAPARFDSALAANYNIGFLFASGPFALKAGKHRALQPGARLRRRSRRELRSTVDTVQQIYNANYQFAVPPPHADACTAEAGDGYVRLSWDDVAERGVDPVSGDLRLRGLSHLSLDRSGLPAIPKVITDRHAAATIGLRRADQLSSTWRTASAATRTRRSRASQYYLGDETGITHT